MAQDARSFIRSYAPAVEQTNALSVLDELETVATVATDTPRRLAGIKTLAKVGIVEPVPGTLLTYRLVKP